MAALLGRDRINTVSGWLNEGAAAWVVGTGIGRARAGSGNVSNQPARANRRRVRRKHHNNY
jgi:hypothetical protein